MRTLSASLLEAQRSSSARPYLRVRLYDRDVGVVRLRWQRWYSGSEPDGACVAAVPADGALLRARITPAGNALSVQRVANPTAASDFSSWTQIGLAFTQPRLGIATAGARVLVVGQRQDNLLDVYESTDSGATYAPFAQVSITAGSATAVACSLDVTAGDGSAVLLYAIGGVVYALTRTGTGAWSAPVAWTQSLATVSGLSAFFELDHNVIVSGTNAAGEAGVWAVRLGAGGGAPVGVWSALTEIAWASAGTDVTYLATGVGRADSPRAAFVESFSGSESYDRVHIASGVAQTFFSDFRWRDPLPFDYASANGAGFASAGADAWLVAPAAVWHAAVDFDFVELTGDVLEAELEQALDRGRLRLLLRNDDGRYNAGAGPAALEPGGELRVGPGYETTAGSQSSDGPRFWIASVQRSRARGGAAVEVEAVDGWGVLRAWTASRQLVWAGGDKNALQVLDAVASRAGVGVTTAQASGEATALLPAFTVRAGERGATAVARLVAALPDELIASGVVLVLTEPRTSDATDYAYGEEHTIVELHARADRAAAGWARAFGDGVFAEAVDEAALREGAGAVIAVDDNLTSQARADARAATLLRQSALAARRGTLVVPPNVAQEVGDVVAVTDAQLGLTAQRYRVAALRLRFSRHGSRPRYDMTLTLTEV